MATLHLNKVERQSLAQNALQALLRHIGKSILIGEGAGGNATWLAADVEPDLIAGAIAVEPVGPPFGTACPREANPYHRYNPFIQRQEGTRIYGLADIPITYDPPAHAHEGFDPPAKDPLDLIKVIAPNNKSECFMQRTPDSTAEYTRKPGNKVRQLINIKKVPCFVVTAQASSHAIYDWAVVAFMMQAGVETDWTRLEDEGIKGNGHLMFLETNSDEIAQVLLNWILRKATPKSFLDMPSSMALHDPPDIAEMIEQALKHDSPIPIPRNLQSLAQSVQCSSTRPTGNEASEAQSLRTPQLPSFEVETSHVSEAPDLQSVENSKKRSAPSSGQTTVSFKENHESPHLHTSPEQSHKRLRTDIQAAATTPSSSSSSLHLPSGKPAEQQHHTVQQVSQAPQQPRKSSAIEYGMPDISMMRPSHPGGPARLKQQGNRDIRSPLESPAFSLGTHGQASDPFNSRIGDLSDIPFGQLPHTAQRENQCNFSFNNAHTTARFERYSGTAEESIAAMAIHNPGRPNSNLAYTPSMTSQPNRSAIAQPQQQIPYLGQLSYSPLMNCEGDFKPVSLSPPTGTSMAMTDIDPPFTPLPPFSALGNCGQSHFGGFPQMTPPSPSPAPRQSLNPLTYDLDTGSLAQSRQDSAPK